MPSRIVWTEERDEELRMLRASRMTWSKIGQAMGLHENTVLAHAKRIGLSTALLPSEYPKTLRQNAGDSPLPAGHPIAWALLTEGTSLAGEPYPPFHGAPPGRVAVHHQPGL